MNLFRCPSKSKSHATCIFKMEYQSAEQRRKFASEFSEVVVQPSTAILGLAFSGTTNEPANTGRTSCSGYSSPVASSQQGLYSYLPALGFFFNYRPIVTSTYFKSCHCTVETIQRYLLIRFPRSKIRPWRFLIDLHLLFILAFLFIPIYF